MLALNLLALMENAFEHFSISIVYLPFFVELPGFEHAFVGVLLLD
jgi:hypothetical protein